VRNTLAVQVGNRSRYVPEQKPNLIEGVVNGVEFTKVAPGAQFCHQANHIPVFEVLMELHDVGMVQLNQQFHFSEHALQVLPHGRLVDHLHCPLLSGGQVQDSEDLPKSASAQPPYGLVRVTKVP